MSMNTAAAVVTFVNATSSGGYLVTLHAEAHQDGSGTVVTLQDPFFVSVPAGLSAKKADAFVRQNLADAFAAQGVIIDPSDIYVPLTN